MMGRCSAMIVPPAWLLLKVFSGASLKSLCRGRRSSYAVLCETLRRRETLEYALMCCGWESVPGEMVSLDHANRLILAHDLLFGHGLRRRCLNITVTKRNNETVRRMLRWQARLLRDARQRQRRRMFGRGVDVLRHAASTQSTGHIALPRYMRVNTLITTAMAVVRSLQASGFSRSTPPARRPEAPPAPGEMWADPHVPGLLVLPSRFELHQNQLLFNGSIILQENRASFFTPTSPSMANPALLIQSASELLPCKHVPSRFPSFGYSRHTRFI